MGHFVVKIHPGSTLCEKKVPAIVFDELVCRRVPLSVLFPGVLIRCVGVYESYICAGRLVHPAKFLEWYHADEWRADEQRQQQ